jgi:predicted GIY-YIG superfamily endonuclease
MHENKVLRRIYGPRREEVTGKCAHCVYSIACECGRWFTGESSEPLAVRFREHEHNLKEGLLEQSKFVQHAYEDGHWTGWNEARIVQIKTSNTYRKYKESAHMTCLTNPISRTSSEIYFIWIPLIREEINKSEKSRDSSVGTELGYGLDDRGSGVRFPAGAGNFSLHHRVQNGPGAHPASYPIGTKGSFPGSKAAGA